MTVAVRVRGPSGTQDHSESELPLVLGSGPEAAVALGAADQAAAAAFIGLRGKRFYVQAAPGTTSLAVNDEPLSGAVHHLVRRRRGEAQREGRAAPGRGIGHLRGVQQAAATRPSFAVNTASSAPL